MLLKELNLINYRNYHQASFQLFPFLNIVIGPNGKGKTNLLEAIYLLARGYSHRTHFSRELVSWGADSSLVKGLVEKEGGSFLVEVAITAQGQKSFKAGGVVRPAVNSTNGLAAVLFAPEHLRIVQGDPEQRRIFLDDLLTQLSPRYGHNRRQYRRILRQRNALLRAVAAGQEKRETLIAWNNQLVEVGAEILAGRLWLVEKLRGWCHQAYSQVAKSERSGLEIGYVSRLLKGTPLSEIKERFARELRMRQEEEIERGVSLVGPHRDDLSIKVSGVNLRIYGSQGEQRTASLALKLAELKLLTRELGGRPVLLLDDVMSELDEARRAALTSLIEEDKQTIITTTNLGYFGELSLSRANLIDVERVGVLPRA